jgi:lysozyme
MNINQATVDLVKRWEGFKARAYICPAGVLTVGYGTTNRAGIPGVQITRDTVVNKFQAEEWLRLGLEKFGADIRPHITAPINENEFGAFVSLAYNIGPKAFRGSSALRHFNAGDKAKAAAAIKLWNKATVDGKRVVLPGLVSRRNDEVALFQTPVALARPTLTPPESPAVPAPAPSVWASIAAAFAALFKGSRK